MKDRESEERSGQTRYTSCRLLLARMHARLFYACMHLPSDSSRREGASGLAEGQVSRVLMRCMYTRRPAAGSIYSAREKPPTDR